MRYFLVVVVLMFVTACTSTGTASWYGKGFEGKLTASGYVYDSNQLTCASNDYGTYTGLCPINQPSACAKGA